MVAQTDSAEATTTGPAGGVTFSAAREPRRCGLVTLFPAGGREEAPKLWRMTGAATVGRGHDVQIRLKDPRVSREHATVEPRASGIFVRDQGSRHGSFVQGVPVTGEGTLASFGSVVRFGETVLLVADDVEAFRTPPRRTPSTRLALATDVVAGPTLARVWDQAVRAARLRESVLILGESGSGKECVARILHAFSEARGPFVGINVAAVPEALFEAELFGHERGAFTGATSARAGAFREASGGVLFLDEIGDLRPDVQAKLLRALDLGRVRPLGASRDVEIDVRIVSATSHDLDAACEAGTFRRDLWYRLSGIVLRVPPLRERPEDVVLHALEALREQGTRVRLSAAAVELLASAAWPGNVRQLRHALTHALDRVSATGGDEIQPQHLPVLDPALAGIQELTVESIRVSMAKAGGVVSQASALLGVSRTTFYNALKRFNLDTTSLRR